VNPPDLVEWNSDERYLVDLVRAGVPIVPTRSAAAGEAPGPLEGDPVVEPTMGAGGSGVVRTGGDHGLARGDIAALHAEVASRVVQRTSVARTRPRSTSSPSPGAVSRAVPKSSILAAPRAAERLEATGTGRRRARSCRPRGRLPPDATWARRAVALPRVGAGLASAAGGDVP
jgi:hypothetical protein